MLPSWFSHATLVGQPGSRQRLSTPILMLDLNAFERNLQKLATFLAGRKQKARPHTKTHKSLAVARKQLEAGAVGVCCTTLGEAEVMATGGVGPILITSPVVPAGKLERLVELHRRSPELMVVIDHPDNATALAGAFERAGRTLGVLVDIDPGRHRTGVASAEDAVALARHVGHLAGLKYRGVQAYAGPLQHVYDFEQRRAATHAMHDSLRNAVEQLRAAGLPPEVVTGGGTGTLSLDAASDVFTDLQPGSYLVMDVDYNLVRDLPDAPRFETALYVLSTVVSSNHPGLATVDAGIKCLATDGKPPEVAWGAPEGTKFTFAGDEHGILQIPDNGRLPIGRPVAIVTPHCDPTINLHDAYHCVRGDVLETIWPIDTRGRSL